MVPNEGHDETGNAPSASGQAPRRRRRGSLGCAVTPVGSMRISDISVSGALLESRGEMPIGHEIHLDLRLDSGAVVHVLAMVVRVQYPDWGRVGGVGVTFIDLQERSKQTLADFVAAGNAAVS
jgi:hypothetical protein